MIKNRRINKIQFSKPTIEGAGVHLKRAFGFGNEHDLDPFLLLDDFRSDQPQAYLKGFPWHPHRGIETITYMLEGAVEHGDSMGNKGIINAGEVQWMTAGSGIIHQEMPKGDKNGHMGGFQLWANLPASHKMMPPRYREVNSSQITEISPQEGVTIKIISGEVDGVKGPVRDILTDPAYLDVSIAANVSFIHPTFSGHTVFTYVIDGEGSFDHQTNVSEQMGNGTLIQYNDGDQISVVTTNESVRFLLLSGKPIREPIAWYGPIVMNTRKSCRRHSMNIGMEASSRPSEGIELTIFGTLLPFLTFIVSITFAYFLLRRFWKRRGHHLLLWGIGMSLYGIGGFCEAYSGLFGWNDLVFRLWYLCGAVLVAAWLGQGTVYLMARRKIAQILMAILILGSLYAIYRVFTARLNPALLTVDQSGQFILSGHAIITSGVRVLTPFFNSYGTVTLVGGAAWSAWLFWRKRVLLHRAIGNGLITIGALLPAFGGIFSRLGIDSAMYILELLGAGLMFAGFIRAITPMKVATEVDGNSSLTRRPDRT